MTETETMTASIEQVREERGRGDNKISLVIYDTFLQEKVIQNEESEAGKDGMEEHDDGMNDFEIIDDTNDEVEESEERESPESNSSSASKRKSFQPQKIGEELGIEFGDGQFY